MRNLKIQPDGDRMLHYSSLHTSTSVRQISGHQQPLDQEPFGMLSPQISCQDILNANSAKQPARKKISPIKLFFKGLKKRTTYEKVFEVFSEYGVLRSLKVPFSHTQKKNMGYGVACFEDDSIAINLCRDLKELHIDGKYICLMAYDFRIKRAYFKKLDQEMNNQKFVSIHAQDPPKSNWKPQLDILSDFGNNCCSLNKKNGCEDEKKHPIGICSGKSSAHKNDQTCYKVKPTSTCYDANCRNLNHCQLNLRFKLSKIPCSINYHHVATNYSIYF